VSTPLLQIIAARLALQGRRGRRLPRLPRQQFPLNVEREYSASVRGVLSPAHDIVKRELEPRLAGIAREAGIRDARADEYADTIAHVFGDMRVAYARIVSNDDMERAAKRGAADTERFNRGQINKQFRTLIPMDIVASSPRTTSAAAAFTRENIGLIRSIPQRYFDDLESTVLRSFRAGQRASQVAEALEERFHVSESRAHLIARDQIGKLNGELTKLRQTDLGLTRYKWRTSLDERVRAAHQELEGELFDWDGDDQPPEGHPGFPVQCRCSAEPHIEDLLEELRAA
jgi:SPP1 gp7 family putative phage head morphogenesis protein